MPKRLLLLALGCATALPSAAVADDALVARLKAADARLGRAIFQRQCFACHSAAKNGRIQLGPPLWNIVGRPVGSFDTFRYSPAIRRLGGTWTYERLDAYLLSPRKFAPGNRMAFNGLRNEGQRAQVLAYLRTLADTPHPYEAKPKEPAKATPKADSKAKPKAGADEVPMPAGPGEAEVRAQCGSCHSLRLVVQQKLSRARWDGLITWMVEEQEMESPSAKDRQLILDYLAKHYGEAK